jgi:hypothetical protein
MLHRHFVPQKHHNALQDPHITQDEKTQVRRNVSRHSFRGISTGPPENQKWCVNIWHPGCIEMHYVALRSHLMQKHKFGVTPPCALFVETAAGRPEHEK